MPAELLVVLRTFGTDDWDDALATLALEEVGSLKVRWAAERNMARVPVHLPGGEELHVSGGGQNLLIAQVIEESGTRYTPGAEVLYLGDAGGQVRHR